jgi:hypothetical protein
MLGSQIAQLVAVIPLNKKGKILGQPKKPKTMHFVEIMNSNFYMEPSARGWWDDSTYQER